jgi:hypothetical protein
MTTRRADITTLAAEFNIARSEALKYLTEAGVRRSPVDKTYPYPQAAEAIRRRKNMDNVIAARTYGKAGGKLTAVDIGDEEIDPLDCTPSAPAAASAAVAAETARLSLVAAREDVERERHRKLKFANDVAEGRSVARESVTATLVAIVMATRTALLALGDRVAPKVVVETDPQVVAEIINAEALACLGELADAEALRKAVLR